VADREAHGGINGSEQRRPQSESPIARRRSSTTPATGECNDRPSPALRTAHVRQRDYSTGELKHNVVALAKAAKALNLPIVVTTTVRDSMWGPTFPELVEALPGVHIIDRSSVNAFDDPTVARAIEATGRKKLIFAGISLEVCATFPAITAVGKGYDAYVAVDASGIFSQTKREAGLLRMLQAGVIVSDYATLMVEILKDNARPEAGAVYGALDMPWAKLVGQIAQAHGK
jgi:nicotinamidase-related amidase